MPFSGSCLDLLLALGQLAVLGDDDLIAGDGGDFAGFLGHQHGARIAGDALFQAGGDQRRFGDEQRHGLALHVRTHQRAVRVVVFQKRNQARRDRNQLLGRNVHVIHPRRLDVDEVARCRGRRRGRSVKLPLSSIGELACATMNCLLAVGGEIIDVRR